MDKSNAPIAIVTGGARRIGRAIALALADAGHDIALHYRGSSGDAHDAIAAIRSTGRRAELFQADLMDMGAVSALMPAVCERLGAPACLVNNASEFFDDTVLDMTPAGFDRHIAVNLKVPVFLASALAQSLPHGASGNVVNIIDQRVWNLTPEYFTYTLSKAGLLAANRMLAQALAPRVRVNAVGPGPVLQSVHQTPQQFALEQASTPLGCGARPEDIAQAVRFILATPAMTGQMIALDGGQHLS